MPRLGELLVAAGLLTTDQVEQALRAQVVWGGRLGTNLVELHYLELDPLSKALARQHQMPAALARHFEKADPDLQRRLSPELAEQLSSVPLLRMGPEQHIVIATVAPLAPSQLAMLAGELAVDPRRLIPAIAAELRIRYQLERVYHIRRTARFLRARGKSIPPFPRFQVLPVPAEAEPDPPPSLPVSTREMEVYRPPPDAAVQPAAAPAPREEPAPHAGDGDTTPVERFDPGDLDDLARHDTYPTLPALGDDLAIPTEPIVDEASGRERRTYVRTIADAPADADHQALLARIAIRKVVAGGSPRGMAGSTLGEATRAIRRGTGRDRVGDLVIDTLDRFAPGCEAAIVLVIRGATAIGWKGFSRSGGAPGEIAVPMEDVGLVPKVVELNVTLRRTCAELEPIDRLLLASLGRSDGDLVVVPIAIADQVMCVIAIATPEGAPVACAEPIAAAAGAAFARLMRDASR
ncbi:MAG TPA: hypothetical protein VFK02_26495 [Kofleriaceae bacterium]|nr:hypothetical protein [Kofleriaceae bacterium]